MSRASFTQLVVNVDYWQRNTPPSIGGIGEIALVGPAGTGAFSGHNNELAISHDGSTWTTFIATTALRGTWLFNKDGSSGDVNLYFGHDGTSLTGPHATKSYVDSLVQGLKWKQEVRAATTANGTLATAFENGDAIDGVTLSTGDRILLKNQTTGSENGIYTVNASGAPTRATDADSGTELVQAAVFVREGTANADKAFVCTNNSITLGSTSVTFVTLTSALGALLASNNLSDLTSAATARSNLGLHGLAVLDSVNLKAVSSKFFDGREWTGTGGSPTLALADATIVDAGDADGNCPGVVMANGAQTWVGFRLPAPPGIDGNPFTMQIGFRLEAAASGGGDVVQLSVFGRAYGSGDRTNVNGNAISTTDTIDVDAAVAGLSGAVVVMDMGGGGGIVSVDEHGFVCGVIQRDARVGNGAETYEQSIRLLWIRIQGTASSI